MSMHAIISADSHFVEPPEMWGERIDAAFRDRAPRLVTEIDGKSGTFLVCEDLIPATGGGFFAAGTAPEDLPRVLARGYEEVPQHVRDPRARIDAQKSDGVVAEVLYSSYGMQLFSLQDAKLRDACFRAFNDWAADYCSESRSRLIGIGLVALDDVPRAVTELRRIAAKGLKGAMIWAEPPEDRPYSHPSYEPFWAAAEELDMKMSLHSLTSKRKDSDPARGDMLFRSVLLYQEVARTMTDLIIHGVLEKFASLKFISAENEIAWIPFHLWRMDQLHEKLYTMSPVNLPMKPSDYFNRQFYATFIEDPMFASTTSTMSVDNIMWSSDFPHLASTYPNSRQFIADNLAGLSEPDRRKIVHDNVAQLYGINV
jgi:predicted TIM-barrel fold metal-dependent hydrolase